MKILQRYFAVNIAQAVFFVLIALLSLTAFMDLTGELGAVGQGGYMIQHAFLYVLMLLAIPLGFVNPRAGSSANLILAMLIFITYSNLVKLTEASVAQGKASFGAAWWPLHAIVALGVLVLFAWRLNVNHRYHPLVLLNGLKHRRAPREVASK